MPATTAEHARCCKFLQQHRLGKRPESSTIWFRMCQAKQKLGAAWQVGVNKCRSSLPHSGVGSVGGRLGGAQGGTRFAFACRDRFVACFLTSPSRCKPLF